ncbi:MAG: nuclear transport factor 2 family protein [Euzebyales bacterium]|nr:nuclear transport factor 2 family protein [Euzebyales bacterium]MDQ3432524.1 nuclear transport factor 2 family protein [Actinomycetota bacterium]
MGRARELWEQLGTAIEGKDADAMVELYAPDAVWLEPHNPPHETNLLIQAYLKDWVEARENLDVNSTRMLESDDGRTVAVEWTVSYTAGGRRWNDLPRSTWIEVDETGDAIAYQRDYY